MDSRINNNSSSINQNTTNLLNKAKTTNNYLNRGNIPQNIADIGSKKFNSVSIANGKSQSREVVGGKAAALYRMQNAGMLVPEFTTVDVSSITILEQHSLNITDLELFIPEIASFNLSQITLASIKQAIQEIYANNPEKRNASLKSLARFIASDSFYNQITNCQVANKIRETYNQLVVSLPDSSAIIVRSSGIKEDNYGDAQAGKFDSIVHGEQDILKTCLQVLASGFQPHVCPISAPQPMALVIQRCIDCSFGGVAMSRSSQTDTRCKIEYVPGQPKGGVSGLSGVTPHCYLVTEKNQQFIADFELGNVTSKFVLNRQGNNNFAETSTAIDGNATEINLTEQQLKQLHQYLKQGEDMLLCPADIEFAIAQDGNVYIVQLRPLTVLTGGVNYASDSPENPLATGILVSEGFYSGKLYYLKNQQDAKNIPPGAIIVAEHGEDWMLETNFLRRVGGFIFNQGGTNDHVAITLRQQEKPCLIVKDNFTDLKNNNNLVTIACCSFNGTSGAYVVNGSEFFDKLDKMETVIKTDYEPRSSSPKTRVTTNLKFDSPDVAFKNLNDLNYKLLDYFRADSWLSRCFTEKGIVALSMAPHRIEIIKEAKQEIEQMFADFELFLTGFKEYLQLGINSEQDINSLQAKLAEAEKIAEKFKQIKTQVNNQVDNILQQFTDLAKHFITQGKFTQLLESANSIFTSMQQLNIPSSIDEINSIHDCIFRIHKEFIDALAAVTINSGLGTITEHEQLISVVFGNTKNQKATEKLCIDALQNLHKYNTSKVVVTPNVAIITAELGIHVCTIEMIEQAEAGKERTLKLKLSDDFIKSGFYRGKLIRCWFLTQLLYNMNFAEDAAEIKASIVENTGILTIEISHIKTQEIMFNKLSRLIPILSSLEMIDTYMENLFFNKTDGNWSFSALQQKLANIASTENQQDFKHLIIILGCIVDTKKFAYINTEKFYPLLLIIKKLRTENNLDPAEIQNLFDGVAGINQEDLVYSLLLANTKSSINLAKVKYPNWFTDKQIMLKLVSGNGMLLKEASSELQGDLDVVLAAATKDIKVLEYADIKFTSDTKFILNCSNNIGIEALKYAKGDARQNEDMVLDIIKKNFLAFEYVCPELRQDKKFLLKAMELNPYIFLVMDKSLTNDKEILQAYQSVKKGKD